MNLGSFSDNDRADLETPYSAMDKVAEIKAPVLEGKVAPLENDEMPPLVD